MCGDAYVSFIFSNEPDTQPKDRYLDTDRYTAFLGRYLNSDQQPDTQPDLYLHTDQQTHKRHLETCVRPLTNVSSSHEYVELLGIPLLKDRVGSGATRNAKSC